MEHKRAWLLYIVIRVLAFAVPFVAVVAALPSWPYAWIVGAAAGTLIGLCVSYIFLQPQRRRISEDIAEMRGRRDTRSDDDRDEDRSVDEADAGTSDEGDTDAGTSEEENTDAENTDASDAEDADDADADGRADTEDRPVDTPSTECASDLTDTDLSPDTEVASAPSSEDPTHDETR